MVTRVSVVFLLAVACRTPVALAPDARPKSERLQTGVWGGEHVALTVTDAGGHLEFDCASGDIAQRLEVDDTGRLDVEGVFIQEHAGPVRVDEQPDRKPAHYSGRLTQKTLTLSVTLVESNETIGSFVATYAASPRVRKCR